MEKILNKSDAISYNNEKIIANILHDIKSPLFSIKMGLSNKIDNELNKDVFETVLDIIEYIDNFLIIYNFKTGKFERKISKCDIKKIVNKKIEDNKNLFINKKINIDMILDENPCVINNIEIFISSIIGNIISNIALHASNNKPCSVEIYKKSNSICLKFKNFYDEINCNFKMGLGFCHNLAKISKIDFKFNKTQDLFCVNLKIPDLKN